MTDKKVVEPQQIEKPFVFPLQTPYVKKNWFGKVTENIDSLEWDHCTTGVVKELINVMKGLPMGSEDPQTAMSLVSEHGDKLAYVIAKAYGNRKGCEPDQSLIDHLIAHTSANDLMQGFYLAYKSMGLEYFMAAILLVRSTASILKSEDES